MDSSSTSIFQSFFDICTTAPWSVNKSIACDKPQHEQSTISLESHIDDPPMQCIIDPNEVRRFIIYQGEELIRQEKIEKFKNQKNECSTASRKSLESSTTSPTTKNLTESKPLTNNLNKYSTTNKTIEYRSKLEQMKVLEVIGSNCTYQNETCKEINSKKGILLNEVVVPIKIPLNDRFCDTVNPCLFSNNNNVLLKNDYYGRALLLHLKMKAHMGKFFWLKYLEKFPQSPIPKSITLLRSTPMKNINRSWTTNDSTSTTTTTTTRHYNNNNNKSIIHSEAIKMMINDDTNFLDLGMMGSLGLVRHFKVADTGQRLKSPNHYKVLLNRRSGVPIAICTLLKKSECGSSPLMIQIFTVKKRFDSQKPISSTEKLGLRWCRQSYPLYTWAELSIQGKYPNPVEYSLYISNNNNEFDKKDDPSYKAFHRTIGSPELVVVGKTSSENKLTGVAIISFQFNEQEDYFSISIAKGIDPALILCLAGIVDETIEKSMRTECYVHVPYYSKENQTNNNKPVRIEI